MNPINRNFFMGMCRADNKVCDPMLIFFTDNFVNLVTTDGAISAF